MNQLMDLTIFALSIWYMAIYKIFFQKMQEKSGHL